MFTGIVETMGRVSDASDHEGGRRISIHADELGEPAIGASVAVNGVCLTVVETTPGHMSVDVIPESLKRSNLGDLTIGDEVNLERAMPASGRFDGHIVQGHVDGRGTVRAIHHEDGGVVCSIEAPEQLMPYVVEKGSITVDGVSLTVVAVDGWGFDVALIPHTLEVTALGLRKAGDPVNLETDVLAKYVERLLGASQ